MAAVHAELDAVLDRQAMPLVHRHDENIASHVNADASLFGDVNARRVEEVAFNRSPYFTVGVLDSLFDAHHSFSIGWTGLIAAPYPTSWRGSGAHTSGLWARRLVPAGEMSAQREEIDVHPLRRRADSCAH